MKKSIIPVAAFIAGMAIVPSVFAAPEEQAATQYDAVQTLRGCLQTTEETKTCKLTDDFNENDDTFASGDVTINKDVTLDLNGGELKFKGHSLIINGKLTIVSDSEALVSFANVTGDAIKVVGDEATVTIGENVTVDSGKALAINSNGEVTVNGEINGANGIWMSAGKTTVNGLIDTDGYAVKVSGGDFIAKGATLNAGTGNALLIESADAPANAITVNVSKSTLASEENNTIAVDGKEVTAPLDYKAVFGLSPKNKDDAKKYGALKSFVLANVDLSTEGEDKHVYNNNGKVTFAEWSVDGKTSTEANLAALTAYNTIDDAVVDPTDEPEDPTDDDAENPNTADTIATYLTIATVALLGLGATAFVAKKSNR